MRRFVQSDLDEINTWYAARGAPSIPLSTLPEVGEIEPGVAAGFLYQTDSTLALVEGYVSNPEAPSDARNAALDGITAALIADAKALGVQQVVALCTDKGIEERAQRHGFKPIGMYAMLAKNL